MLAKQQNSSQGQSLDSDYFIYCLEGVNSIENTQETETQLLLEDLSLDYGIASIYNTCDTIEGLETSLNTLVYDDHNFKDYEIIYFVVTGEGNSICLNDYYYSLQEIAEIFEGSLNGKILHFSNTKVLDLDEDEAQYFLDITGAKAIAGYGYAFSNITSAKLDKEFFNLFNENDNVLEIVEQLHKKYYKACRLLDFRLYY